jgi:hypothetical protein
MLLIGGEAILSTMSDQSYAASARIVIERKTQVHLVRQHLIPTRGTNKIKNICLFFFTPDHPGRSLLIRGTNKINMRDGPP